MLLSWFSHELKYININRYACMLLSWFSHGLKYININRYISERNVEAILNVILMYVANTWERIDVEEKKTCIHNKDKPKIEILSIKGMIINKDNKTINTSSY